MYFRGNELHVIQFPANISTLVVTAIWYWMAQSHSLKYSSSLRLYFAVKLDLGREGD